MNIHRLLNSAARITRDASNDQGGGDEAARLAAKATADAAAAAEAERLAAEAAAKAKEPALTDTEAKLLKEAMKAKKDLKAAKEAADAASARLAAFGDVDPDEVKALVEAKRANEAAQAEAERTAAEKRGEYDRLLKQTRDEAEARVKAQADRADALQAQIDEAAQREKDLVIGMNFNGSKFLSENTVLSGPKARKLFGEHFEIEDGEPVAYDKPRGAKERTPIVDTKTGAPLAFDAALEKIMKGDPDFEGLAKSKLKPGASSTAATHAANTQTQAKKPPRGSAIIANNLKRRTAS
jgi:hypothetical protein